MVFQSKQIHGLGRGKEVGFPTINLTIPEDFDLETGVYAVWVIIDDKTYKGALHYGPIPTFDLKNYSLEVHLLNIVDNMPDTEDRIIEVDIVERLRDVKKFMEVYDLTEAILKDVEKVNRILK